MGFAGFTPWGFGAGGAQFTPWGFGYAGAGFAASGFGAPLAPFGNGLSYVILPPHSGGTYMNAFGMGSGFVLW